MSRSPGAVARAELFGSSENTYRVIALVGTSPEGGDRAIHNAIGRVGQSLKQLKWFELREIRGHIDNGEVAHTQVSLRIGFKLEPPKTGPEENWEA